MAVAGLGEPASHQVLPMVLEVSAIVDQMRRRQDAARQWRRIVGLWPWDDFETPNIVGLCPYCDEPWGGHDEGCPNGDD